MENRINRLLRAQEKIEEAIELIKAAVAGTGLESGCDSYVIPSLKMCMTENHGYLSEQSFNIDELIRDIKEGDSPDIEDDCFDD